MISIMDLFFALNTTIMSKGSITDPIFNHIGKDYGILIDHETGHHYLYLKDNVSQFYPHGTPVEFQAFHLNLDLMKYTDPKKIDSAREKGESPNFVIDIAVIIGYDEDHLSQNGFAKAIYPCIRDTHWEGKTDIDREEVIKFFLSKEK